MSDDIPLTLTELNQLQSRSKTLAIIEYLSAKGSRGLQDPVNSAEIVRDQELALKLMVGIVRFTMESSPKSSPPSEPMPAKDSEPGIQPKAIQAVEALAPYLLTRHVKSHARQLAHHASLGDKKSQGSLILLLTAFSKNSALHQVVQTQIVKADTRKETALTIVPLLHEPSTITPSRRQRTRLPDDRPKKKD